MWCSASEPPATERWQGRLRELEPVRLEVGDAKPRAVGLWNEYVERFHPLGYKGAFGYRLRYFISLGHAAGWAVFCSAGAAKAIAVRDRWIGWDAQVRLRNLPRVINNSRFLIFPHVRIPHLASHVLGQLGPAGGGGLAAPMGIRPAADGDLRGPASVCRHLLPGGRLGAAGRDQRPRAGAAWKVVPKYAAAGVGQALGGGFPPACCAARRCRAGAVP